MYKVELKVLPTQDNEEVSGTFMRQRNRGGTWINEESVTITSHDEPRVIMLEDGQRVVVEARSNVVVTYDRGQSAAVPSTRPVVRQTPEFDRDESPPSEALVRSTTLAWLEEDRVAAAISEARFKLRGKR